VEAWTTIRYLRNQGKGKKTIARELGIARNTVRRALGTPGPPRYRRPARPNPQLLPFVEAIRRMREEGFIGSRVLRELRQRGYHGSRRRGRTPGCACATRRNRGNRGSSTGAPTP
jgi:transposase